MRLFWKIKMSHLGGEPKYLRGKIDPKSFGVGNNVEILADEIKAVLKIEEDKECNLDDFDMIMEDNDAVKVEPNYGFSGTIMQMEPKYETMSLDALSIGSHWLQDKIFEAFVHTELAESFKLANDAFKILVEGDDWDVDWMQWKLLLLFRYYDFPPLQFRIFNFIKFLLRNRLKIVWCIRLSRARFDVEERKKIEEKMVEKGPELAKIVDQLRATRTSAKERERNLKKLIREEARQIWEEGERPGLSFER